MDRYFYLALESRIEERMDEPLVDVVRGFLEDCATHHLAESRGRGQNAGVVGSAGEDFFVSDLRRRMSRWQHAVKACFERAVVDADSGEQAAVRLGRSVGDIEKALGWIESNGESFADALVSSSTVASEEPPCQ